MELAVWLKFYTLAGHPKVIISTNSGANLNKSIEVTFDYLH